MKEVLLYIVLFFCITQQLHSQEDGVVAFDVPARNSLRYNRFIINPTFSFVRESNKYIALNNKRQWTQFEDNPNTYLFSYSGRQNENMGIGIGLFQQNYGVLTTFGGVLNYAYNVALARESNLTFGLNAGFYQSTIDDGNIITNLPDPSLANIEKSSLITINPAINYGVGQFDFGLSVNNAVLYNLKASEMVQDNPEQSFQGQLMFTGYMNSPGFFDESKFSTLVISEFKTDKTVLSGLLMLMVPKGIWAQAGYNTLYGITGGLGLNITPQIAIEYNFEKSIGMLDAFGSSHDITLAYKFKSTEKFYYAEEDEELALLSTSGNNRRKPKQSNLSQERKETIAANRKATAEADKQAKLESKDVAVKEEKAAALEAEKLKIAREQELAQAKLDADAKQKEQQLAQQEAKKQREAELQLAQNQKAEEAAQKAEQEKIAAAKAKQLEADKIAEAQAQAKAKAIADTKEKVRLEKEAIDKANAEAEAKKLAEVEAQNKLKLAEEQRAIAAQQEIERLETEALKLAEAEAKAKAAELAEAEEKARELAAAEAKAKLVPKDETTKSLISLAEVTETNDSVQQSLLTQFEETVDSRRQDLNDLKEENDLGDQGIFSEPKPFKSITEENNKLMALKTQLETNIKIQDDRIKELQKLYDERFELYPVELDEINLTYKNNIEKLKANQLKAIQAKSKLEVSLKEIEAATDFERKRRIKRASYDDETDRYNKDRATLNYLLNSTPLASTPPTEKDFDFGEVRNDIQILKNVNNIESGYYMVVAIHQDIADRDEFLKKVIESGRRDINFFYDLKTSKYYIYYEKFTDIASAERALQNKGNRAYNGKMSMVKIEN
ncbi:type IX secretion system membrane protein, PorP/SprF family [Flavobacteriaceae bacterium MAR_2010_188]|nr:type IX secretion system membrane protein, PorP/SprF family [Flavobacteriaceae bacterium MAR_2010_188]